MTNISDGIRRSDVPYVWPEKLIQPSRPPLLIYLDLNHWINLSKAMSGHSEGIRYQEAMDLCLDALESGIAVFPISSTTYIEVSKIRRYEQRVRLRQAIESLSQYRVIVPRAIIAQLEIEAVLNLHVGPSQSPLNYVEYMDWGVARAFGKVGGLRVYNKLGEDVTENAAEGHELGRDNFFAMLAREERSLNRKIIEGPSPEEESELRALGWGSEAIAAIASQRSEQEIEQAKILNENSSWRRGKTRDLISAREVVIEVDSPLTEELLKRSTTIGSTFPTRQEVREVFDSMPSFDVSVTLKTSYHRNSEHHWKKNDIHDIDALTSSLPYCDVVVTDKAVVSHVDRSGLAQRLGSKAFSNLDELSAFLSDFREV